MLAFYHAPRLDKIAKKFLRDLNVELIAQGTDLDC